MRIGFTGHVLGGGKSGIGTYVASLLKKLAEIDTKNEYKVFLSPEEDKFLQFKAPNFNKHVSQSFWTLPVPSIIWHNTALPNLTKTLSLDLVHIPSIRRIPLIKRCPIVTTVHDLAALKLPGKYDLARTLYHSQILSRLIHRSDRVITVSHHTKKDIIELLGYPEEKISVIYPGVDFNLYKRTETVKEAPFFVYVSRIEHPAKNHIRLIEAFEKFKKSFGTNHALIFAGADWNGASIVKERAAASPYADEIRFLGFVSDADVVGLYSSCDLMIYPSLYEGFGLPVIEAMACGAKVAVSHGSSLEEIAKGAALFFNPNNPQSICAAMEKGLNSHFDTVEHAQKFRWEKTAEQVLAVYHELAG